MDNHGDNVQIRTSRPGDAGYVAYMHGKFYHEHHSFFVKSEYYFIKHLAEFVNDPDGGALWVAEARTHERRDGSHVHGAWSSCARAL